MDTQTIAFMPHCSNDLNENLLRANWTLAQLSKLVLIANDFGCYVDRYIPADIFFFLGPEK
jgi:hypothetical protein